MLPLVVRCGFAALSGFNGQVTAAVIILKNSVQLHSFDGKHLYCIHLNCYLEAYFLLLLGIMQLWNLDNVVVCTA